jgi:hypothetical protein
MIKVLIVANNPVLHVQEFERRFKGKFAFSISRRLVIEWEHMRIIIVNGEPRGYLADIAIGFNQDGVNIFTRHSRINIAEKRATTYFDLLDAINDDGSFNWERYLS